MWVMVEELATKKQGKSIYFRDIVSIGPRCTDKLEEAAIFATKQEAMMSPAYVHPLSCFEPVPIETIQ